MHAFYIAAGDDVEHGKLLLLNFAAAIGPEFNWQTVLSACYNGIIHVQHVTKGVAFTCLPSGAPSYYRKIKMTAILHLDPSRISSEITSFPIPDDWSVWRPSV